MLAATLGTELLRISPGGKFQMFRLEIEGTWVLAGETLVLTPTKVMGQSPDTLRAAMTERAREFGAEAEEVTNVLVLAFTAPFNLIVKPDGSLYQGPSLRGLDPYSWVRDVEPPLVEQLRAMDVKDEEKFDMALYAYCWEGIADQIEHYTPGLIDVLGSDLDDGLRYWAAIMLGKSKNKEAMHALVQNLSAESKMVRSASGQGLNQMADPDSIEPVLALYKEGKARYATVANLIGKCRSAAHVGVLVEGLKHEDKYDRQFTLEALSRMPPEAKVGDGAIGTVRAIMREDTEPSVKAHAAIVLQKWSLLDEDREQAFQTLVGLVGTGDWMALADVVEGLGHFGFRAVRHLVPMLKDSMFVIRREAAEALEKIGVTTALEPLREAFKVEEDVQAREAMFRAIKSLEGIGTLSAA
ncbi:MAG: HEAT repeat domain-containing protein [Fimbriimonadaceae bacterium]